MDKELIEQKFKKLSDANKIRYNLGRILFLQDKISSFIFVFGVLIVGYLFSLPFIIWYGGFNRIIIIAFFGTISIIVGWIFAFVALFKSRKDNKALEKFLIEKSKK